jgi:hypothetical protein
MTVQSYYQMIISSTFLVPTQWWAACNAAGQINHLRILIHSAAVAKAAAG